jgi:ribokinase
LIYSSSIIILIDSPLETIEAAASLSHRYEKTVIWDAGVRSGVGVEKLEKILKNLDYVVVNQVEVNNLTGEENAEKAWKMLSNSNDRLKLIVKLGEKGCLLISPDKKIEVTGINLNELNLQVVNTVGCGDSFLGVFGAYKSLRLNDREALERANLAGALKATRPETRGSPTKQILEHFLRYRK